MKKAAVVSKPKVTPKAKAMAKPASKSKLKPLIPYKGGADLRTLNTSRLK